MDNILNAPRHFRLYGAVLAMAALLAVLLAVTMTAGPTMAQTDPYPDPKPCGPGQEAVPDSPDATITEGHYAVFDGYWDFEKETLELNLCPPSVVHRMVPGGPGKPAREESTRTSSNVDIQQTVFHINGSDFEHQLDQDDLDKYDFFKLGDGDDAGTEDDAIGQTVWWLKVDDESTPNVDEDSALAMGFSAALFESDYWYLEDGTDDGAEPLQYEFEVIREPGIPIDDQGHVFAFDDSDPDDGTDKTAYWDSSEVDANALPLYPGAYHHFQWAFTKPGTYVISVQLKGHVRQENPHDSTDADYDANWKPVSEDNVVTSEVRQYVFQIGDLTLNHEPGFMVERSVDENSAAGTLVGEPITVHKGDNDTLTYSLSGPEHSLFRVEADTDGNAQIKVGENARLDHELKKSYRLTLGVSDNRDHERNPDDSVDDTLLVKVLVNNVTEAAGVTIAASQNPINTGETLYIYASVGDLPNGAILNEFEWSEERPAGSDTWYDDGAGNVVSERAYSNDSAESRTYQVDLSYWPDSSKHTLVNLASEELEVVWQDPQP